jgi:hypothetical protein
MKEKCYLILTYDKTFMRWFREAHNCPLVELPLSSACHICSCGKFYMRKIYAIITIHRFNTLNQDSLLNTWICATE